MRHRERLTPPIWFLAVCLLVVPASVLVFLPISPVWGWVVAIALYIGIVLTLIALSPVVEVDEQQLRAGRARIPVAALGGPTVLAPAAAHAALHEDFDAAAYVSTVPWTTQLVRIPIVDESDPTTAWLVSTRSPEALARAIETAQAQAVA